MKKIGVVLVLLSMVLVSLLGCASDDGGRVVERESEDGVVMATPVVGDKLLGVEPADLADFEAGLSDVVVSWDGLHEDFAEWRLNYADCEPGAMRRWLHHFAVRSGEVTDEAREFSRHESVSEVADMMIVAAEQESASYRRLRDRWQSGNVSLFEDIAVVRDGAEATRRVALDALLESREDLDRLPDGMALAAFEAQLLDIEEEVELARSDLKPIVFRAVGGELRYGDRSLLGVSQRMTAIADAVQNLDDLEVVKDETRQWRLATRAVADVADEMSLVREREGSELGRSEPGLVDIIALEPLLSGVESSEMFLAAINDALDDVADLDVGEDLAALDKFEVEYTELLARWDDFYATYDAWRAADGGCDRDLVMQELGDWSRRIDQVGREVRSLSVNRSLTNVRELLVVAIAGEESAWRVLRDTWRPFTVDGWRGVEVAMLESNARRREAELLLSDLRVGN